VHTRTGEAVWPDRPLRLPWSIRPSPVPSPATAVGVSLLVMSPVPSCPSWLSPQQTAPPPISRAHVWWTPVARATTPAERGLGGRQHVTGETRNLDWNTRTVCGCMHKIHSASISLFILCDESPVGNVLLCFLHIHTHIQTRPTHYRDA
jgi:hypothetical protein